MRNLRLSNKLIGSFILIALMILLGGSAAWYGVTRVGKELKNVSGIHNQGIYSIGIMAESQKTVHRLERSLLTPETFGNESEKGRLLKMLEEAWNRAEEGRKIYESLPRTKDGEGTWNELKTAWDIWKKDHNVVIQMVKDGKRQEALAMTIGKAKDSAGKVDMLMRNLSDLNLRLTEGATKTAQTQALRQKMTAVIVTIIGIVLAISCGIFFTRSIAGPIKNVIENLSGTSRQFASTSGEIASSSHQLAQGTSHQAMAAQDATSIMDELVNVIRQNADDVVNVKTVLEQTNAKGTEVYDLLGQTQRSIKKIKKISADTVKITKTINEIAFQTSLLSLSASVEAARTGEAGAGFAIVAEEVRNLARRSGEAVKNTSDKMEQTIRFINKGSDVLEASVTKYFSYIGVGQEIQAYTDAATEVTQKQAEGIDQIRASVEEINRTAQSNASSAQEAAAVAQQINAQAESMKDIVAKLAKIV
jgi:methyl-accepting chemotaxis protein